jgi:H+/Cl- antiporter ClcA
VFLSKIAITTLGLVVGASVGREGPTVQIGAGLMLLFGRWGGIRREQGLILAGSAAGIAGAFNTPLAGVVFAIEEMSRSFEARTNGLVLYAVIIAGLASLSLVGDYTYFGTTHVTVGGPRDWLTLVVVGVVGGLAGGAFGRGMLEGSRAIGKWCRAAPLPRRLLVAGICGLVVAAIGVFAEGSTFGTGYEQARAAIEGQPVVDGFWIGKFAATLVTALSGIPGGIFAPSLSVGAGLGDWIGGFLGGTAGLAAVLGMASYFAGAVQSPMTAFVIIMEMTNNQSNLVPLMLASIIGYAVSRWVAPEPLYHGLSLAFAGKPAAGTPKPAV